MIKGAFIDYKIRRPQLRDDGPLMINTNVLLYFDFKPLYMNIQ
jgi:hypothetical protein